MRTALGKAWAGNLNGKMVFFWVIKYSSTGVFYCTWWHGLLAGLSRACQPVDSIPYYEASMLKLGLINTE